MPHFPKPFFRPARGLWYVQLHGKQLNLGPDRDSAFRQYGQLISRPSPTPLTAASIAVLLDLFLDWCKLHREERTYDWYKTRCQSFLDSLPADFDVSQLKPYHVQQWVDGKRWNAGMKRGAIVAIQRAFNWLAKQGRIDRSPIAGMEKPPQGRREKVISCAQYKEILALFPDSFGDMLQLAWETGARAQEILRLEARHFDGDKARWVFPALEAKGKKRPRIVYLTDTALGITKRLVSVYPEGRLLRNEDGVPWTRHAVSCRFSRLKKKIGEKLCLTNFRHSFATRRLEQGSDSMIVAALLGHKDLSMLGRVYGHLGQNGQPLIDSLKKGA
jgi:integrase